MIFRWSYYIIFSSISQTNSFDVYYRNFRYSEADYGIKKSYYFYIGCGAFELYEIGRTGNNVKLYIESLQMEKISQLAKYMPGRITVSAAGKPHIAIKVNVGEDQLSVIRKALDIMSRTDSE